jgi:predicted O-linked N-acetylglucosamine transferase (SPINDLY family)
MRRLRIGYVSPDFRRHSVSYFIEPILEAHDRSQFEVFCYADELHSDEVTRRLRGLADHWRNIASLDDEQLAQRVREDGIDILIDLAGHTEHNRLLAFARRPAPVQMTYLGYPNTTAMPAIQYRITDAVCDPQGSAKRWHVEELLRVPGCFLCYRMPADMPEVHPLPAGESGPITFGSFNNFLKVSDSALIFWERMMKEVAGSRLMLKFRSLSDRGTRERVLARLERHGIAPERVELLGYEMDFWQHLELYRRMDIALDPFPYNGTTTTCEALAMGVPVVCLAGEVHAARVGASLMHAVGLDELVARTLGEYVRIATGLASDRARLRAMRSGLRARLAASALTDAVGTTRRIEALYRSAWVEWCRGGGEACP